MEDVAESNELPDIETIIPTVQSSNCELESYVQNLYKPHWFLDEDKVPLIVRIGRWAPAIIFFGLCSVLLGGIQLSFYYEYVGEGYANSKNIYILQISGYIFCVFGIVSTFGSLSLICIAKRSYFRHIMKPKKPKIYSLNKKPSSIKNYPTRTDIIKGYDISEECVTAL